jgi:phosphate starvation-inducible PhoH-like protein
MTIKACSHDDLPEQSVNIKTKRKFIHISSKNQQKYVLDIKQKDCTFGIGPAGTGKTYLAVARAGSFSTLSKPNISYKAS